MFNKGTKYLEKKNYLKAISCFKKEENKFKELYLNLGNCYKMLDNLPKAMECYLLAANDSVPFANGSYGNYALAYNNIGLCEYTVGDDASAMQFYSAALTINPLYGEAIFNYGNACLRSSDCTEGWDHYEYRFKRGPGSVRIDTSVPTWDGQTRGDRIVVLTEQGFGDKIMFARYLSLLESYFDEVVIMCHPSLDCLYPYKCVRSTLGFSVSVPLCSLPRFFGIVSENWLDGRFKAHRYNTPFNIGVCWSGSPTHANDRNRSCSSNYFSSLSSYGTLYNISPDPKVVKNVTPITSMTWSETASYLLGLDLVVSVDTSIVHLAGTLGVPCIMVQPLHETDFRWGNARVAEFGNNPWYRSVMVVPNTGWDSTFAIVDKKLKEFKNV